MIETMNENERERWRGGVDADIESIKRDQKTLFTLVADGSREVRLLALEVRGIGTKVAVFAAIGGVLGGSIIAGIFSILTKGH